VVRTYRDKFRSSAREGNLLALPPKRQTPRYLHVIAGADDEHQRHLETAADHVAELKWTVVEEYAGLSVDIMRQQVAAIH
jgi:hypothetical protein